MDKILAALNQKKVLYGLIVIAVIYEAIYGFGLGGMVVDFTMWYLGIGYIIIPIAQSVFNLIKPENTLKIAPILRLNLSIILGVIAGVLFGGFLNLGLLILGTDGAK